MHRDIKPHNLLYDIRKQTMKIIDWGLAEFYRPGEEYNVRVSARFYKAPELLLANTHYDYSLDMWSLGCIFAALVFQQETFFQGKDETDQLLSIAKVVGTDEIYDYVGSCGLKIRAALYEQLGKYSHLFARRDRRAKKPWQKFRTACNETYATDEALSLLTQLLVVDHTKRLTAKDAMAHPYFAEILQKREHGSE